MISVDWTLGLQFLNFIILLIILNKLLYRPLMKIINERRATIEGSHAKAQELESQIDEKMRRYQQQLDEAKTLAAEERNKLKKAATEEEARILSAAHEKATAQLQTIRGQVAEEAGKASVALKGEAQTLAGQIATKVLGRELA